MNPEANIIRSGDDPVVSDEIFTIPGRKVEPRKEFYKSTPDGKPP